MAHQGKRMVSEDLLAILESISNNGIAKITTTNIKTLSNEDIDSLKCGDIVAKVTGDQKHAYIVSYKEDGQGICLTYIDATYVETISYDYTDGNWVYNSQDSTEIQRKLTAGSNITIEDGVISATDTTYTAGTNITIEDGVISASGGTVKKLYHHKVLLVVSTGGITTTGYENYTIQIVMEMFTDSSSTPTYGQCFQNARKEFMSGIILDVYNTAVYEIIDGDTVSLNLQNNGTIWINLNNVPTSLSLNNQISSSANGHVTSLGYDEINLNN